MDHLDGASSGIAEQIMADHGEEAVLTLRSLPRSTFRRRCAYCQMPRRGTPPSTWKATRNLADGQMIAEMPAPDNAQ